MPRPGTPIPEPKAHVEALDQRARSPLSVDRRHVDRVGAELAERAGLARLAGAKGGRISRRSKKLA